MRGAHLQNSYPPRPFMKPKTSVNTVMRHSNEALYSMLLAAQRGPQKRTERMAEKPIIMTTPMVQAYLEGRKTQTRRLMHPAPEYRENTSLPGHYGVFFYGWNIAHEAVTVDDIIGHCPHGKPGDDLWWRETWAAPIDYDSTIPRSIPGDVALAYKASPPKSNNFDIGKWRPSIYMPRWASRIVTPIVKVRFERLQQITDEDAEQEGFCALSSQAGSHAPRENFQHFWDTINHDRASWDDNPWVWVIEFERYGG